MKKELFFSEAAELLGINRKKLEKWAELEDFVDVLVAGEEKRLDVNELISFLRKQNIPVPKSLKDYGKPKILLVEDDVVVLESVRKVLELSGEYAVFLCTNGMEAAAAVRDIEPELIITDLYMPKLDGFKLCRMLKDTRPEIKIIAISGGIEGERTEKFLKTVPDIFLKKPFEKKELLSAINKLL